MDHATVILVTLIAYQLALLLIGLLAQRRTRDEADFFLGGRRLGPLVAAISASASSSSVWTLLGVSGYAYLHGLAALWLFPACVGGFALNWYLVAPRLRRRSGAALTLTEFLAGPPGSPGRRAITALASIIILLSLMTYVAAQFQGAGSTFERTFEIAPTPAILLGAAVVVAYTLLGGFWAVSITDTLQGLMMAGTAIILPVGALVAVGGFGELARGLQAHAPGPLLGLTRGFEGALALGFIAGLLGIGLGYPGQPHVVNRFMALSGEAALRRARIYAMVWAAVVYAGMILLGLCGRLLATLAAGAHEDIFIHLTGALFPPVLAGIMIAAVLSAIMSTADSQLLVASSTLSHDLGLGGRAPRTLLRNSRLTVLVLSILAILSALLAPETIFKKVLFAWAAMGAAFGPLLLVRLWRGPVPPRFALAAMASGFTLSVAGFYGAWSGVGIEQHVLPYLVAAAIALWPSLRAR